MDINVINLADIRRYLEIHPPKKKFKKVLDPSKKIGVLSCMFETVDKKEEYFNIKSRLLKILKDKNSVLLNDSQTSCIVFDETLGIFTKAKYDISEGKVCPINSEAFKLNNFKQISPLSIVYFDGNYHYGKGISATASFLEIILNLSDVPVLEIGEHVGDTCNRYLPIKKYGRK